TNMVIASSADVKDASQCIGIQLPVSMRDALALANKPENLGKEVMLKGDVMKYCGGPGLKNLTDYRLDGKGPDVPDTGDAIFSETFANESLGGFTIENIDLPAGLDAVWKGSKSYGAVATAFISATKVDMASDSRLVSPVIDLGSASAPTLAFEHAVNFFTDIATARQQAVVEARVEGGEWETLEGVAYPNELGWSFVPSGNISLQKYSGKKIQIAFHYVSTAAKAGTWEVKNVIIK
ncbi:MAG: choice-of-anchor J domain-containing protein, partial [Muribaculaceae bacterium]|nr:choice-of-anchor J domain-containing protein [Muribaculaceae bacterium]